MTTVHPFRLILLAAIATALTLGCTATPPAATTDVATVDDSVAPAADASAADAPTGAGPTGARPTIPAEPSGSAGPVDAPGPTDGSAPTVQPLPPSAPQAPPPSPAEIEPQDPTLGTWPSAPETEDTDTDTDTSSPAPTPLPTPRPSAVGVDPLTPQRDALGGPSAAAQQAPATAASLTAAQQSAQAQPVVLERGHVDVVEVTVDGTALRVSVKDDTQPTGAVFRSPSDVQFRVPDSARIEVPAGPFGFLGPEGSAIHLLPQVEDRSLVWPGWSTERISAGQVVGDAVTMSLTRVDGPGKLALFTTDQFGMPTVLFDSAGGSNSLRVPIRTHAHSNWSFSAPGVYRVTFEVAATLAGGASAATTATYAFLVGADAQPLPAGSISPPQAGAAQSTPGDTAAPGGGIGQPAGASADVDVSDGSVEASGGRATGNTSRSNAAGSLARTGTDPGGLAFGGGTLFALGAVALMVEGARRRRQLAA